MINNKTISSVCEELNRTLSGGRIDKIQQPAKDLLIITVRTRGVNRKLLLSAAPGKARVHLTSMNYENPSEPPMFCVLLRKHLTGAVIEQFLQPGGDRLIVLELKTFDELGRESAEKLIVEMIPGKTNIILVGDDGLIVDCAYRRDYDAEGYRRLFPGMIYRFPKRPEGYSLPKDADNLIPPDGVSVSAALDSFYSAKEKEEVYHRRSRELRTALSSAEKRIRKKLEIQRNDLARSMGREDIRRRADLITANIWQLKRGDRELRCADFYQDDCPEVTIPLDPLLSPQTNASKLYKQYNKLKTAEEYLTKLIDKGEAQLDYIASVQDELSRAFTDRDILEIRRELVLSGFLKNREKTAGRKEKPQMPVRFVSPEGYEILAGRNNIQNDELTFRVAHRDDLWFHVKSVHGSHVLLRCGRGQPDEDSIMLAAAAAVCYSQGRDAGTVAVDYTRVRNVRKIPDALPGRVSYTDYQTLMIRDYRMIFQKNNLQLPVLC